MMLQKRLFLFAFLSIIVAATAWARVETDRTGSMVITYSTSIGTNECGHRVCDNDQGTKWLTAGGNTTGWIRFDLNQAYAVDGYTIRSANDSPDRTPKNWALEGSNDDGSTWTVLDTRADQTGWTTYEKRSYTFTNTTVYKNYRLNVSANNGSGNLMGFSEIELLEGTIDRTELPGTVFANLPKTGREGIYYAFDGTTHTKWLSPSGSPTGYIGFQFADGASYRINGYAISSANDYPTRDPKNWNLEGSNDGTNWVVIDTRTDEFFSARFQRRLFECSNFTPYNRYRLNVTANNGDTNLLCISELELLDIESDPIVTTVSPKNFTSTSANPLTLSWGSVFHTGAATFTMHFGTDPNFVDAGTLTESGLTVRQWTVPETSITEDTPYYWRVDIVDDPYGTGTQTFQGSVNKFRVLRQPQKALEWSMDNFGAGTVYDYEIPVGKVTATASSQEQDSRSPSRTVGGWGLTIDKSILDPNGLGHSNNAADMWICNPNQTGTVWIQFAFDTVYQLGTMDVWNHNVGDPYLAELSRGMRDVIVSYSLTGEEGSFAALGTYTIPMGTGAANMPPSIEIPFGGALAKYVRITAASSNSNWGAVGFHALSEVRFGIYNQPVISYVMPDATGHGNDGRTYVDPRLVTEAISGSALELSGNDQIYMEHTDANFVETLPLGTNEDCYDSWTMNFYAMFPKYAPSISFISGFGGFDTGTGRYLGQFSSNFQLWGGHNVDVASGVQPDLNRWQMITATYENGRIRLYKNAVLLKDAAANLGVAVPNVYISGPTPWGTSAVEGLMDEFTIYRGALSQAQIDALQEALPTQYAALNPVPANGATLVGIDPVLKWEAPLSAINPTYSVYLGTAPESLTQVASGLTETQLDTIGLGLAYETTYYWYVDTANGDVSETWSFTTMPAANAASLALGWDFDGFTQYSHTFEAAVANVTATASSYENPTSSGRSPDRAVNGVGLQIIPQIPGEDAMRHSNNATFMWISQPDVLDRPWIKFAFDQPYTLGTMHVWNHNVGDPWLAELNRGMRDVIVRYGQTDSTDPNAFTVLGNFTIPMGTGQDGMPYSIAIPFGGIQAQYVMIQAAATNSNWGSDRNFHALSEVRFGILGTTATSQAVTDVSGHGNDGLIFDTPEFVNGLSGGNAAKIQSAETLSGLFDHIDAYIADANVLPLAAADTWSMNMFVDLEQDPGSPTLFGGFGGTPMGTGRYVGRFFGVHFWGGDNIDVSASQQYRFGHWQMVTVTYNGAELKLYHNGVEVAAGTPAPGAILDAEQRVTVGGWNPWGRRIDGLVDNFEIYNGVLTRAEIQALADAIPMDGDMDWDYIVDVMDLPLFAAEWLAEAVCTSPSDFTGDCKVNLDDFAVIAENWLKQQ